MGVSAAKYCTKDRCSGASLGTRLLQGVEQVTALSEVGHGQVTVQELEDAKNNGKRDRMTASRNGEQERKGERPTFVWLQSSERQRIE